VKNLKSKTILFCMAVTIITSGILEGINSLVSGGEFLPQIFY